MAALPEPSIERLLQMTRVLENSTQQTVSSSEIESRTGWSSHTIRKDISYLSGEFSSGSGYDVAALQQAIRTALGLDITRKACVVGLGRLGSAYLNFPAFANEGFDLVAGFDASVNRVEILRSPITLYPAYKMVEVISRFKIELALLCVPAANAQAVAERLVSSGIKGIVNFAPIVLELPPSIAVRNVYVVDELRAIAAYIASAETKGDF
ncbi:redox-sensing transcriptional repressor Rex [Treponema sp.]